MRTIELNLSRKETKMRTVELNVSREETKMMTIEFIEFWILKQIENPEADPYYVRSWYKYGLETPTWSHLTKYDAQQFCKLAREAGQKINRERYNGKDGIRTFFPGIYENSKEYWSAV